MKRQAVKRIERGTQAAAKSFTDRKSGLIGIQQSMSRENDAYSNLVSMDASALQESKLRKQENIKAARMNIAAARDKQQAVRNERIARARASAQGDIAAGTQNLFGGLSSLGQTAIGAAGAFGGKNKSGGDDDGGEE
jgi:hypothetical protein